jgi:tripartite-type tricarboxylate transporter receptor subunit TctC
VAIGPHVKTGRIKALGVTSAKRYAVAPELPTLQEAGVKDFDVSTWIGALAPARIGASRQQALHEAVTQSLSQPAVKATLSQQGLEWVGSSPADFEAFMNNEAKRWSDLVIAQRLSFG